jgi:hypothetical protein
MVRLTLTAPDDLFVRLREIARDEGTSLAEVMREALELRAGGAAYAYALPPAEREHVAAAG